MLWYIIYIIVAIYVLFCLSYNIRKGKKFFKKQNRNSLNGRLGTVKDNLGGCAYEVLVYSPEGNIKRTCWSETGDIEVGTEVTLQWNEKENKYFLQL